MKILISNDDGYESEGLRIIAEKLSVEHDVFVVAPDRNRSAVSHHFTIFNDNTLTKIRDRYWAYSGYPADCVFAGLSGCIFEYEDCSEELKKKPFDLVITGINYGPNLGTDIIYSGTCGGARQAMLNNVPAIALSVDPVDWAKAIKEGFKFEPLADFVVKNLEKLVSMVKMDYPRAFVNINGASISEYKGVKFCKELCMRNYDDKIELHNALELANNSNIDSKKSESGKKCLENSAVYTSKADKENVFLTKLVTAFEDKTENKPFVKPNENTDLYVCRDGYLSISMVYADPLCCDDEKYQKYIDDMKF
ncbi:MAG: 5'/3'-nucleotidase SurE [Treponema sp.]|nr:5'/3'-nucleotidase SurE [Treponema sp.]